MSSKTKEEMKLMYFSYDEKVTCPFCEKVITIPRVRDLIIGSEEDKDPTLDLVILTSGVW